MKRFIIGCVVLFASTQFAFSQVKLPLPEISVDLGGGVKLEMLLIPAGAFDMGHNGSKSEFERPQHGVKITKPFYCGKYEVTQEQWKAVMGTSPSKFPGAKNPVESVSWADCQAFVQKLNEKLGAQAGKFGLPTEAQWEYACRAGTNPDQADQAHAGLIMATAWYDANSEKKTHPVGEKKPNAWGLYDMQGNVWEWCVDWYGSRFYSQPPGDDPNGPAEGTFRVLRGGGWNDNSWACRPMARGDRDPELKLDDVGLRVIRSADK